MIIRRIWWQPFRVPYRRVLKTANAAESAREGVILTIETDAGFLGLGEASPLPSYSGGSLEEAWAVIAYLAPRLLGLDPRTIWDEPIAVPGASSGSLNAVRCGLETAAGSLLGQAGGLSLAGWMSNRAGLGAALPAVPVNGTIDAVGPKPAAAEASRWLASGVRSIKVKVDANQQVGERRAEAVRRAVGPEIELRIDPNGSWPLHEVWMRLIRYRAFADIALCEQPISPKMPTVVKQLAKISRQSSIIIAADESCRSLAQLQALIEQSAVGAVVIKPMVSGLREALTMLSLARANNLPVIVTTTFDAGLGTAAAVHLAALVGETPLACGLATLDRLKDDLIEDGLAIELGMISVPQAPGLGVKLDNGALTKYAVGPRQEIVA